MIEVEFDISIEIIVEIGIRLAFKNVEKSRHHEIIFYEQNFVIRR